MPTAASESRPCPDPADRRRRTSRRSPRRRRSSKGMSVQPPLFNRLPTALSFGKNRRAHARSTTTASRFCRDATSRSSSRRPSISVSPSVGAYSGDMASHGVTGCDSSGARRASRVRSCCVARLVRRKAVGDTRRRTRRAAPRRAASAHPRTRRCARDPDTARPASGSIRSGPARSRSRDRPASAD